MTSLEIINNMNATLCERSDNIYNHEIDLTDNVKQSHSVLDNGSIIPVQLEVVTHNTDKLTLKEAKKAEQTAAKEAKKADQEAAKEAKKAEQTAAKEAKKAEQIAAKEAKKAEQAAVKEAKKAEQAAVKEAKKVERENNKKNKNDAKQTPHQALIDVSNEELNSLSKTLDDELEEIKMVEHIEYEGNEYYMCQDKYIYSMDDENHQCIGKYNILKDEIDWCKKKV